MKKSKHKNDVIRITVVGDGSVGKTFMLVRFATDELPSGYEPTVFENYHCKLEHEGNEYDAMLMDTAGQEGFDKLRHLSYPNTDCFIVCFAVDSRPSFENIRYVWVKDIRKMNKKAKLLIVGTKCDLRGSSGDIVSEEEAQKLVKKCQADKYVECSAYTKEGINEVFSEAINVIVEKKKRRCVIL